MAQRAALLYHRQQQAVFGLLCIHSQGAPQYPPNSGIHLKLRRGGRPPNSGIYLNNCIGGPMKEARLLNSGGIGLPRFARPGGLQLTSPASAGVPLAGCKMAFQAFQLPCKGVTLHRSCPDETQHYRISKQDICHEANSICKAYTSFNASLADSTATKMLPRWLARSMRYQVPTSIFNG